MILAKLLEKTEYEVLRGSTDIEITEIVNDSRKVKKGCVFPCIRGAAFDGHKFAAEVASKGLPRLLPRRMSRYRTVSRLSW